MIDSSALLRPGPVFHPINIEEPAPPSETRGFMSSIQGLLIRGSEKEDPRERRRRAQCQCGLEGFAARRWPGASIQRAQRLQYLVDCDRRLQSFGCPQRGTRRDGHQRRARGTRDDHADGAGPTPKSHGRACRYRPSLLARLGLDRRVGRAAASRRLLRQGTAESFSSFRFA